MKQALRDYQQELYDHTRTALFKNRSVLCQLATGGGKTPIMGAICDSVMHKKKRAWIVVNRSELLGQASKHLVKWGVPHGMITPKFNEMKILDCGSQYDKILKRDPHFVDTNKESFTGDRTRNACIINYVLKSAEDAVMDLLT